MPVTIQNVETLSEALVEFLESKDIATFGQDIYLNEVPSSRNTNDSVYWILTSGGQPVAKNRTGEIIRMHAINIFYRSTSGQEVEKKLHSLGEMLSDVNCIQLTGFETLDVSVSQFPAQQDMDVENRKVGFLVLNIQTYKRSAK